jgi:asparagine synthase (glutamine-hydrolysing)
VDGRFSHYDRIVEQFHRKHIDITGCSPSEALLHYYIHEGMDSLKLIRGSFVFALWNRKDRALILGRDPYGTKRLYYADANGGILFASDLTGLARMPLISRSISTQGLVEYFTFGYINPPYTIYENIALLDPGEYILFQDGHATAQYFHPPVPPVWECADLHGIPEEEIIDTFGALVVDAVKCRLPAGNTVAAYLSGGLDTGLLAAVLRRYTDKKITAYTLGSNDPSCDEAPAAREVTEYLGIEDHRCHYITKDDFVETLEMLPEIFGQPMADISAIPNFVITRAASKEFSEIFAGDGPDGLFGNWDLRPWYYYYRLVPSFVRPLIAVALDSADRLLHLGLSTPSRHISELLRQPEFFWVYHKKLKSTELKNLLGTQSDDAALPVGTFLEERRDIPLYERLRYAFSRFFVVNGVLQKSCAVHSALLVNQICPFYDRDLIDFVERLPTCYKIRGVGYGKYLHKKLLYRHIPSTIWDRRKQGFIMNLNEFGLDFLRTVTDRYLHRSRLAESGFFNVDFARKCIEGYYEGNERMGPVLYTLLVFELWRDAFLN